MVQHVAFAQGHCQPRCQQRVVGLEPPGKRQGDAATVAGVFDLDILTISAWHGRDQPQRGPGFPDGVQIQPAPRGDFPQGGQRHRIHVRIDHRRSALWQQLGEQS